MVTFLETGLLKYFTPIFVFLFVLVVLYALLQKTKILGGKPNLDGLAAIAVSVLVLFSTESIQIINLFTPWVVVIFVFLILLFLVMMSFGTKEEQVWPLIGGQKPIVIILILLLIIAVSQVFSSVFNPQQGTDGSNAAWTTNIVKSIFHPRVLGAIFILIVAAISVQKISETVKKPG